MTEKEEEFVRAAELAAIDSYLKPDKWVGNGRKPAGCKAIALAFIAKAIWDFPTTVAIIDYLKASRNLRRLCGWEPGFPRHITMNVKKAMFHKDFWQFKRLVMF